MSPHQPRVVSLLPSATEIVCAAGGEALLVGRSHECDWPPGVRDRPVLTAARTKFVDSQQMHDAVGLL
jgi:iron complex transport system substrate-binding protein